MDVLSQTHWDLKEKEKKFLEYPFNAEEVLLAGTHWAIVKPPAGTVYEGPVGGSAPGRPLSHRESLCQQTSEKSLCVDTGGTKTTAFPLGPGCNYTMNGLPLWAELHRYRGGVRVKRSRPPLDDEAVGVEPAFHRCRSGSQRRCGRTNTMLTSTFCCTSCKSDFSSRGPQPVWGFIFQMGGSVNVLLRGKMEIVREGAVTLARTKHCCY